MIKKSRLENEKNFYRGGFRGGAPEYTYHDTNQTDKAREQKLRREAVVIGELKRKYDC